MSVEGRSFTDTSPAAASTVVSSVLTLDRLDKFTQAMVVGHFTGATGGDLDVYLQMFDGVDWVDYLHFPQIAAGATIAAYSICINRETEGDFCAPVGRNATPALPDDTCVGGEFGDRFRVVFVAGVSTSAGASQIIRIVGTRLS